MLPASSSDSTAEFAKNPAEIAWMAVKLSRSGAAGVVWAGGNGERSALTVQNVNQLMGLESGWYSVISSRGALDLSASGRGRQPRPSFWCSLRCFSS